MYLLSRNPVRVPIALISGSSLLPVLNELNSYESDLYYFFYCDKMFDFCYHSQDLWSGFMFYRMPDSFQPKRFQRLLLPFRSADLTPDLSYFDFCHRIAIN